MFRTRTHVWQLFACSSRSCLHLLIYIYFSFFFTYKNSMLRITTCTHWITCTGVIRRSGMVPLVGMRVNWRRLWENICLTFLKNNLTYFISWWVKVPVLCYNVVWCLEYGLGCACSAVVWSYMLLNPFDYFICSFYFLYILCLRGNILFLASVIWTYMLVSL